MAIKKRIFGHKPSEAIDDPIKSHDGMDIDCRSGVVETAGYGFKQEVAQDVIEAFEFDVAADRASLSDRLHQCRSIPEEEPCETCEYER